MALPENRIVVKRPKQVPVTVRVPPEILEEIDRLVAARIGIHRHTWLLEAVYEKLHRERPRQKQNSAAAPGHN